MKRLPFILSFLLFVGVCASASFWVMQFIKPAPRKISAPPAMKPIADIESVAGLFGGAMAVNTNYQLKGIVLANPADQSGAIIAVDGKPTQAYRIDAEISQGVTLSEVHAAYVLILDNGVTKRLELPQDFKSSQTADNASIRAPVGAPSLAAGPAGNRRESDSNFVAHTIQARGFKPIPAGNAKRHAGGASSNNNGSEQPPDQQ